LWAAETRAVGADLDRAFLDLQHGPKRVDGGAVRVLPWDAIVQARVETVVVVLDPAVATEVGRHAPASRTLHELEGAGDPGAAAEGASCWTADGKRCVWLVPSHICRGVNLNDVRSGTGQSCQYPTGSE